MDTESTFPFVTFRNTDGKQFCIPRDSIVHTETYASNPYGTGIENDHSKTYVTFKNPNTGKTGNLYAVVDMTLITFRETILRPAYEARNTQEAPGERATRP